MALFVRKLSNILASKLFVVVLISLILTCLSIFPIANASAQTCGWNWDILSISDIKTNYQPGEIISGSISFRLHNAANSSAIQQLLIGIIDSQNKVIDVKCIYNGVPKTCPAWTTGTASFSLKAPVTPGNYKVIAADYFEYSCSDAINKFPSLYSSTSPYCKDITTITISAFSSPPTPENVSAQACGGNWDISSTSGIKTNYQPGETISGSISFKLNNPSICPSCTQQVLVGIIDSQNKVIDVKCVYDGIPKVCPLRTTGTASFSLKTPAIPGNYKIIAANYYQDSCSDAINKYLPNQVGSQAALVQYKDIATVTIAEASPAPVPPSQSELEPTPIPNPFEYVVPQIEKSITQIKQKIDLIIQQIWHITKTIILPLAILAIVGILLWKFIIPLLKDETPPTTPPYFPKWTFEAQAMENEREFKVWDEIKYFRLRKHCIDEKCFKEQLYQYLKNKFPRAETEVRIRDTIIDIRIDKIAIEVKGPTRASDFNRLRGQIQNYTFDYELVYVVLFAPKFSHAQFNSLKTGILRDWPNDVGVITKPG